LLRRIALAARVVAVLVLVVYVAYLAFSQLLGLDWKNVRHEAIEIAGHYEGQGGQKSGTQNDHHQDQTKAGISSPLAVFGAFAEKDEGYNPCGKGEQHCTILEPTSLSHTFLARPYQYAVILFRGEDDAQFTCKSAPRPPGDEGHPLHHIEARLVDLRRKIVVASGSFRQPCEKSDLGISDQIRLWIAGSGI
jgi:hypothetical protein